MKTIEFKSEEFDDVIYLINIEEIDYFVIDKSMWKNEMKPRIIVYFDTNRLYLYDKDVAIFRNAYSKAFDQHLIKNK